MSGKSILSMSRLKQIGEVQLTSMMDLSFLLLIVFIITFPMIEQGIPVNLPKGKAKDIPPGKMQTVTVDRDGKIYLDNVGLVPDEFAARMLTLGKADPSAVIMVRADEAVRYGAVVKVLRVLHDAGISKMALVTREEGKGRR